METHEDLKADIGFMCIARGKKRQVCVPKGRGGERLETLIALPSDIGGLKG